MWRKWGAVSKPWKNVCLCAALAGASPFPLPEHEAARIEYYLNNLLKSGVNTQVAAESASTHYSILEKDIAALRARGATDTQLEKLDELAAAVLLMIDHYHD